MKTYAESVGKEPFDWLHWLRYVRYNTVKIAELEAKAELSSNWVTCACGNMCDAIPRSRNVPRDGMLSCLGIGFCYRVNTMLYAKNDELGKNQFNTARRQAIEILHKIEKRSCEILEEMINE